MALAHLYTGTRALVRCCTSAFLHCGTSAFVHCGISVLMLVHCGTSALVHCGSSVLVHSYIMLSVEDTLWYQRVGALFGRLGPYSSDVFSGLDDVGSVLQNDTGLPGPHRQGVAPVWSQVHGQVQTYSRGTQIYSRSIRVQYKPYHNVRLYIEPTCTCSTVLCNS